MAVPPYWTRRREISKYGWTALFPATHEVERFSSQKEEEPRQNQTKNRPETGAVSLCSFRNRLLSLFLEPVIHQLICAFQQDRASHCCASRVFFYFIFFLLAVSCLPIFNLLPSFPSFFVPSLALAVSKDAGTAPTVHACARREKYIWR